MGKLKVSGPPVGLVALACSVDWVNDGLHAQAEFICDFELAESHGNDRYWGDDYWQKKGQERFHSDCQAYWRSLCGKLPGRYLMFYDVSRYCPELLGDE